MSKFSIYLKNLIEDSGESISFIARSIEAERTSIHKALTDERILSYKVVQALARHFNLPVDKKKEFFRLYDILLQGEESYENRQAVCSLLNALSSIRFSMLPPPQVDSIELANRLIKGEYAVRNAIRNVLIYEATHTDKANFSMYVPEKLDLTMELMELWLAQCDYSVDALLCFYSNHTSGSKNIQLLRSVIPLCLASRGSYRPYYFCETPKAAALSPMSYYIITPHYLIQLSEDLSMAQIRDDTELIEFYQGFFRNLLECCDPLVRCNSNILEVLQEYISNTSPDSLQIMMPQPCTGRYITPEVIRKYMHNGSMPYKEMYNLVEHHFSVLQQINGTYQTVFTEKGLQDLITTRTMMDLPPQYVPPLENQDIRQMLRYLYDEIDRGSVQGMLVRPTSLQLPDYLSIYVHPKTGLHIYTTNAFVYGAYCCNIHIAEASICRIFYGLCSHLPEAIWSIPKLTPCSCWHSILQKWRYSIHERYLFPRLQSSRTGTAAYRTGCPVPACFWRVHSFSAAQRILAARKSITAYSRSAAASDMPGHQSVFTFKNTNITYC